MSDQNGEKAVLEMQHTEQQHQGDTGHDIRIDHRDIADAHDDSPGPPVQSYQRHTGHRTDDRSHNSRDQCDDQRVGKRVQNG